MRLPPRLGLSWLLLAVLAWSPAAATEPSAGFSSDEVALTLVADEPGADGSIRAALSIDLAPGWKTYWIDPGDAGIPPSVDLSGSSNVVVESLSFPPPHRFGDEYASSNGYSGPMAIALRLRQDPAAEATVLRAKIFIGVCRDLCIPVAAELTALPGTGGAAVIAAAFGALPGRGNAAHGIDGAALSADGKVLTVSATAPGSDVADLFVAGPKGWSFGAPAKTEGNGGSLAFTLPVLSRPRHAGPTPPPLDIVMTSRAGAVEALSVIPRALP
jgi:DsbC/DsbD-like thiol-disulfide interchange protein